LDKGRKNVELLKQPQYQPVKVEEQVALIYCGTKGLLKDVPADEVKAWKKEFIETLQLRHPDLLEEIKSGKYTDEITSKLNGIANDVAEQFVKE